MSVLLEFSMSPLGKGESVGDCAHAEGGTMKWIMRERVKADPAMLAAEFPVYGALRACCLEVVKRGRPSGAFAR